MIINFKIFEKVAEPKFNVGNYVYVKTDNTKTKCKIKEVLNQEIDDDIFKTKNFNFYILEEYPYMKVREDQLIPEYEINAKKYNL